MIRVRVQRVFGVLLAALVMIWPALYNGFPFFFPDSTEYLDSGRPVARALFLHDFSGYYGMRSLIYGLGILPLHWNTTAWPVVIFNALLTAYVLWLVVRSLFPQRTPLAYFGLVAPLSFLTGMSWIVSWIMPDILGPVLYLTIYLMIFCWNELGRAERIAIVLIAWWALVSHITHLMLACGLCVLLVPVLMLQHQPARQWVKAIGGVASIVAAAALAQFALNAYLYGTPSLNGQRPPVLLARVIADGPGRWYLEQRCPDMHFAICDRLHDLPGNVDDLLWDEKGILGNVPVSQQKQILQEEMPIVLGAVRAYPREQFITSMDHFWEELHTFTLSDFGPDPWVLKSIDEAMPGARSRYLRSRQAQNTVHDEFFSDVQNWTVITAVFMICVWAHLLRRSASSRLTGLTAVILFAVLANAAVTGILSNVEDRYQVRVVWLVPLLAGIFVLTWLDQRRHPDVERPQSSLSNQPAIPSTRLQ
jgi:hypothetical protein